LGAWQGRTGVDDLGVDAGELEVAAYVVAPVRREEALEPALAHVALAEADPLPVVDLRVGVEVVHSLDIADEQDLARRLVREVAERYARKIRGGRGR
jgi:hypothetical protein